MATDYNEIGQNPRINYRKIFTPYSDKTHFIYELVQNADDNKSQGIEMQLYENELIVWNDGCQFSEEDVRSICSIGFSNKDLTQIGTFGMGFKAVYAYTDNPEVYSGDERFRISISNPTQPEGIDGGIDARVLDQLKEGKRLKKNRTIFRLPFRKELRQEEEIALLKNRFRDLEKRALLFLRNLKTIQWYDGNSGQRGSYSCHRRPHDKIQDTSEVELRSSLNGEDQSSETFLVFRKEVRPLQMVIDELLQQSNDEYERQRIQKSAKKLQPIEIAFEFQDGKIIGMNNCVLFSYFPTEKETHLKFLIQASYKTTLARDNIERDNQWNEWLIKETANYLPEIFEELKEAGLLEPTFFNILPLKDEVEDEFKPIAEAMQEAMQEREFIPIQSGEYAEAKNVFYPHRESLPELIESDWLYPNSNWLDPAIGLSGRVFDVMKEAGVKEIGVSHILGWLEKQDLNWFENRCEEWLRSMYVYLNSQKSELERIKKLPLVRLENGKHVCANDQSVFFPSEADEARKEIKPFLSDLPVLRSALLEGEECNDIEAFLKSIGVRVLRRVDMILEGICPQYLESAKPSAEENDLHVRYIFKVWGDVSESGHNRLKAKISEIPLLRAYKGTERENSDFIVPCDAYLPKAYTGDADLETYFSAYDGDVWFVDEAYLDDKSDAKTWHQFLKIIGAMDTPRIITEIKPAEEQNLPFQRRRSTKQDTLEQPEFEGMFHVLEEISEHRVELSKALWCLLVKAVPSKEGQRGVFLKSTYRWSYYGNKSMKFDSFLYSMLTDIYDWLPDEQNNFDIPSKYFAPTSENRRLLADSVAYLHPDFNINTEPAQWLAERLGVRLKPDTESVLNYLQKLSNSPEVSVAKVEPLYRFLQREVEDALRDKFKKESLIFTSNPEPRWWRVDEVFWEDESEVFKNDRGYLKAHYPTLNSFFTNLGVSPQASQRDYACRIQEIATTEQVEDEKIRERVQRLYRCLQPLRQKKWEIIYDSRCWLGKKGEEWEFFTRQELVLKDHPYIGEIFEGEVPFWMFDDDLSNLARNLKLEGCSQAAIEFHPEGNRKKNTDWSEKVRKLRPYIYAFLNSPRLCEEPDIFMFSGNEELQKEKFAKFSTNCSVWRVKELRVTYELKGTSVTDPNPRQSFLDVTDQQAKLWLGLEENEDEYPELIGDALQDYFGVKDLGRFVENLLEKKDRNKVLSSWKRKGLDTKFLDGDLKDDEKRQIESLDERFPDESNNGDANPAADESDMRIPTDNETSRTDDEDDDSLTDKVYESETHFSRSKDDDLRTDESEIKTSIDSEAIAIDKSNDNSTADESKNSTNSVSDIRNISSPDAQSSTKIGDGAIQNVSGESESETPTVHEDPETENGNDDSKENEPETSTYQSRSSGSRTRPRGGKAINTPNGNQGTGHSNGRSGDREDDTHMAETGTSSHARREIEHIGMKHAYHYEKKQGRTPEDVSSENRGYDIYSTSPDGKNRCIEVKARADRAPVLLTSNEWSIARELKDGYFLYVVLNATAQPELYVIQNPADEISAVEQIDVRYHVPLSEIMEHGIRV